MIQDGVFGVPLEIKLCFPFDSTGQVLEMNDIFQDGHLLQLKTYCFSKVSFF